MALGGRSRSRSRGGTRKRFKSNMRGRKRVMGTAVLLKKRRKPTAWKKSIKDAMSAPSATNQCKTNRVSNVTLYTLNTKTLYGIRLNNIEVADALVTGKGFGQQERLRAVIDLRGWRLRLSLLNASVVPNYFHYAIVSPKSGDQIQISLQDFFRDHEASRDVNFSTALETHAFHDLYINPDKFHILSHNKIFIPKWDESTTGNGWSVGDYKNCNYKVINKYVPLKRPVTFDDDDVTQNYADKGIFLLYWCAYPLEPAPTDAQVAAMYANMEVVTYYREPK